jgi:hypothetical protein
MPLYRWSRERWEAALYRLGCKPCEGLTSLNTAEWWQYPWGGYPFTVPVDEDGYADYWAFEHILAGMHKLAPPDWQFPDPEIEPDDDPSKGH